MAGIGSNIFASTGVSAGANIDDVGGGSASVADQTYGPSASGGVGPFSPRHGVGAGFWLAVAGVVVLVVVRQSLPR